MAIDTLSIARELRAADVPSAQAEAIASAIGRSSHDSMEQSATKSDLNIEATLIRSEIEASGSRLEAKIEALQSKLIMWFIGTQLAFVALIAAMVKL